MQVIVDGWGRVIKEPEQMEYLKKLEFIPFKVRSVDLCLAGLELSSSWSVNVCISELCMRKC